MNRAQPTVAFFCMLGDGHFNALAPVIGRIAALGMSPCVFTHASFRERVERLGGRFIDLFAKYPIEQADDESRPLSCRNISFAAFYAERIIEDLRRFQPALIIYEAVAVIGPVVARALGIPYVCVCVGHNVTPAAYLASLQKDSRVAISDRCHRAAERLRTEFGLRDASPFSFVNSLSPFLNLYDEPPEFLDLGDRAAFEPLEFFGCVGGVSSVDRSEPCSYFDPGAPETLKVYVSFGTVVWWYFADDAVAALRAIADACAGMERVRVVISLGGADVDPELVAALEKPNARVLAYVDQARILEQADLFITHHGVNSTHEAIFARVPMISYPFHWDQPALARKCQDLGLALPLTATPRGAVTAREVQAAFARFAASAPRLRSSLDKACLWEKETIAQRDRVMQRVVGLIADDASSKRR